MSVETIVVARSGSSASLVSTEVDCCIHAFDRIVVSIASYFMLKGEGRCSHVGDLDLVVRTGV